MFNYELHYSIFPSSSFSKKCYCIRRYAITLEIQNNQLRMLTLHISSFPSLHKCIQTNQQSHLLLPPPHFCHHHYNMEITTTTMINMHACYTNTGRWCDESSSSSLQSSFDQTKDLKLTNFQFRKRILPFDSCPTIDQLSTM